MSELSRRMEDDYYRMTGTKFRPGLKNMIILLFSHQIRYMRIWRRNKEKPSIFKRFSLYRYSRKYALEISPRANIGRGLYLGHPYGITVAGGVRLGDNCNLHKGCTIGRENRGDREGVPTIGNSVSVGINSTIVGRITIGDDVMIAPNSYVNFDVPSHSVVLGNPGTIHLKENATQDYIRFQV